MTVGILTSRRKKGTLYKAQLKNPTVTNRDNFRAVRNLYNVVVRTAKKTFLHSQIENNAKNLRKTWQILSNSIHKPKNNKKNCASLIVKGANINDLSLMAESFKNILPQQQLMLLTKLIPQINQLLKILRIIITSLA